MNDKNMLLGHGETLTYPVNLNQGRGEKRKPYTYNENKPIILKQLNRLILEIDNIPLAALPDGKAVAKFILHPTFLAKSYFPVKLLKNFSLESLGSKLIKISPRKDINTKGRRNEYPTICIYVAGKKDAFQNLYKKVVDDDLNVGQEDDFVTLESISILEVSDKIKIIDNDGNVNIEVALHTPYNSTKVVDDFEHFASQQGAVVDKNRSIQVKGLTFIPIKANKEEACEIAKFSFLRTLRELPKLRVSNPVISRSISQNKLYDLPSKAAIDPNLKVAIFDGGLGIDDFSRWVTEYTFSNNQNTSSNILSHGQDVTSTLLFGAITSDNEKLNTPFCNIDHYRVLDSNIDGSDTDLFDVLIRIKAVLEQKSYNYVNLSLGPRLPLEDDDVHVWTATLEEIFAAGNILCTVAVGNDGDLPPSLNRIQPPSDLVNGLAVGAATSLSENWERCSYSCIGPGRSPGYVKPDGVAFGGCADEPFQIYNAMSKGITNTAGTSFAAPLVLRQAIAISASLQYEITPLTAKALLIHHAKSNKLSRSEVGWGRFPNDLDEVTYCGNDEVKVIYQGVLKPSQYMRASIPFPDTPVKGRITIRATFCFSSPVDAEHPVNYTRSGLEIIMRKGEGPGLTFPLFNSKHIYTNESEQRRDGHKWETTLKSEHNFDADKITNPCFDIIYYGREGGMPIDTDNLPELPYVLVLTISAEEEPELYNIIRQKYRTLEPIQIKQEIMLRV